MKKKIGAVLFAAYCRWWLEIPAVIRRELARLFDTNEVSSEAFDRYLRLIEDDILHFQHGYVVPEIVKARKMQAEGWFADGYGYAQRCNPVTVPLLYMRNDDHYLVSIPYESRQTGMYPPNLIQAWEALGLNPADDAFNWKVTFWLCVLSAGK